MLKVRKGTSPARRFMTGLDNSDLTVKRPEKNLIHILRKESGRDNQGHVSSRHIGGREKRYYRLVDFARAKRDISGRVISVEYDPNRTVNLALIQHLDGSKSYILHPEGLKINDTVMAGENVEIKIGNALPLGNIPIGQLVHNVELIAGRGGKIVRSAGSSATVVAKEGDHVTLKLPSGETRLVDRRCYATIGQLGNIDWRGVVIGSAGRSRHMGIRPTVRGTAQNPRSHPHGGGEGRSGEGMKSAKTPWGKIARGVRTRNRNKYSSRFILERRRR